MRRRFATATVLASFLATTATFGAAGPAAADSATCVSVRVAGVVARNCVETVSTWPMVGGSRSSFLTRGPVCDRVHQWRFRPVGSATYQTKTVKPKGCVRNVSNVDWKRPGRMQPDSKFCARTKNSRTGNRWTPYACVTGGRR